MSAHVTAMDGRHVAAARRLWADVDGVELSEGDDPAELERYLARNPGLSTVALDEHGAVVAAVLCGHDGRRGLVYHLAVARHRRREGLGHAVMQRSLAGLAAAGIRRVLLLVAANNAGGQQFWLREGWEDMPFAKPMGLDL